MENIFKNLKIIVKVIWHYCSVRSCDEPGTISCKLLYYRDIIDDDNMILFKLNWYILAMQYYFMVFFFLNIHFN